MMLRMYRGQKIVGHFFEEDYSALYLEFQDFVLCIDLIGAKWKTILDLRVFPSPVIDSVPWEKGEDFNSTFKKYKKGKEI